LLGEHILDVTIAQSKTEIELDGPLDDECLETVLRVVVADGADMLIESEDLLYADEPAFAGDRARSR